MTSAPWIATSKAALVVWARARFDRMLAVLLFAISFAVFETAAIHQVGDSRYTLLLSETILRHGDFTLDRYHLVPPARPGEAEGPIATDYRLYHARGHTHYLFPVGSSLLSIPYVAGARLLGGRPLVRHNGTYDSAREDQMQLRLAALLMAAFCMLMFWLARLLLPRGASTLVALVMTFGTQIYSTASRALWSDTWGVLLVGLIVHALLRWRVRSRVPNGLWLGTLGCWAYFVRPTNLFALVAIVALLVRERRAVPRRALSQFVAVSLFWMAAFAAYSLSQFGAVLPFYYRGGRLGFGSFFPALAGCLISPGRGLFIYVPVTALILFLVARTWRHLSHRPLAVAALAVCGAHLLVVAGYWHWWGGHSFGPRLFTGLTPWFALLAILAVDGAHRAWPAAGPARGRPYWLSSLWFGGSLICAASIAINSMGATSPAASNWNALPVDIDHDTGRLWNWRHPQFLAGITAIPYAAAELPPGGLALGGADADLYLGLEWSRGELNLRWTDGPYATLQFLRGGRAAAQLEIVMEPYLTSGLAVQHVTVRLNGRILATTELRVRSFEAHLFPIPEGWLQSENLLRLDLPDAASPAAMEGGADRRRLGVAVRSIRLLPQGPKLLPQAPEVMPQAPGQPPPR